MAKVLRTDDGRWLFQCPACDEAHGPNDSWQFNGDTDRPTFSPSILVRGTVPITDEEVDRLMKGEKIEPVSTVCHSFVRNGSIQFLGDCSHALAGQTVEIADWDL